MEEKMSRKRIYESDSDRATASRKRRREIPGPGMLKLVQASMTLDDTFVLDDLREAWGLNQSQVLVRLLREAEQRYAKEIKAVREARYHPADS